MYDIFIHFADAWLFIFMQLIWLFQGVWVKILNTVIHFCRVKKYLLNIWLWNKPYSNIIKKAIFVIGVNILHRFNALFQYLFLTYIQIVSLLTYLKDTSTLFYVYIIYYYIIHMCSITLSFVGRVGGDTHMHVENKVLPNTIFYTLDIYTRTYFVHLLNVY